jgi:hypothetical protein
LARWTETPAEVKHITELGRAAPLHGIVWVRLKSGSEFYGLILSSNSGSNAGDTFPPTRWFSDVTLQLENKQTRTISLLDIEAIRDAWNEKSARFAELGLIQIVDD